MAEHRNLGDILMDLGRVDASEVEAALAYQRENGGYFGEALVSLGFVSPEELDWGLAAQFDLPYVFPEAENIDPEAAAMVTPEWALTHLALPIMRTADSLTVVVDSPLKTDAVEQLRARTDRAIDLALAPASKIRELIRRVYGRPPAEPDRSSVASLPQLLTFALEAGSERFGVSLRGSVAHGWYDERGTVRRMALRGDWRGALDEVLSPPLSEQAGAEPESSWSGRLVREGVVSSVNARYLSYPGGSELLLEPVHEEARLLERFAPPPPGLLSEIRLLARNGAARCAVPGAADGVADEMLPYLPALLFDASWRSVHLVGEGGAPATDAFTVSIEGEGAERADAIRRLRAFHFDAVSADLGDDPEGWAAAAADVAGAAFVRWPEGHALSGAADAGIRWELRLQGPTALEAEWSLVPLER